MIIDRVKNIWNNGKILSDKSGKSTLGTIFDFIFCKVILGTDKEDYIGLELYKKSWSERNKFTSSRRNYKWLYKNHYTNNDKKLLESKSLFNEKFNPLIKREWISTSNKAIDKIDEFIDKLGEVIVKPDGGLQGIGVYKLKSSDIEKRNELRKILNGKGYLAVIEEVIRQHPDMAYFNSSCVNTCRIETVTDNEGKAHIINTIVIIGGKNSEVSNTHTGGVMVHIDPESGIVDSKGRNPEGHFYLHHPGTGVLLLGRKIPYWKEVKNLAIKIAEQIPSARYVGWDIAITENGPELIEGNLQPGHITQACDMVGRWPLIKSYL